MTLVTTIPSEGTLALFEDIRAILFDLDGTLISADTEATARIAKRLSFLHSLVPQRDLECFIRRLLMAIETPSNYMLSLAERMGLSSDGLAIADRIRHLKGLGTQAESKLLPGVSELLHALKGRYRLAVVTSRSRRAAIHFLQAHQLDELIEVLTTRQDTWLLKPHASPVRHTARLLGLPTEACLMVGDTPMDIWAAKSAGAIAAGVLSGFGELDELRHAGADLVLERVTDLRYFIPEVPTLPEPCQDLVAAYESPAS